MAISSAYPKFLDIFLILKRGEMYIINSMGGIGGPWGRSQLIVCIGPNSLSNRICRARLAVKDEAYIYRLSDQPCSFNSLRSQNSLPGRIDSNALWHQ